MKENRAFTRNRQVLHEIFLKPQYKRAEVPQSSISMNSFSVDSLFLMISQISGYWNQQHGKKSKYQPCPSRLTSRIHPFGFL